MVTIKQISAFPYSTRLKFPFKTANVVNFNMDLVIVEVKTKEGFIGYGEGVPAWEVTGETQHSMLSILNEYLIPAVMNSNTNPHHNKKHIIMDTEEDLESVCASFNPTSLSGIPQTVMYNGGAKCALEIALYDVYSKAMKQPLSQLFSRPRLSPSIESVGVVGSDTVKEALAMAQMQIAMGATSLKFKVGVNAGIELEILKRIRQDYPTLHINLDANQGFLTPQKAIDFMNNCARQDLDIEFLEQPCNARNLDAFSTIKDATVHTGIKIGADESVQTYYDALNLIESDSVDVINLKLMKHGGYREAMDILRLARKHMVQCKLGSMIENSLGTAANYQFMKGNSDIIEGDLLSFWAYEQSNAKGLLFDNFKVSTTDPIGIGVEFLSSLTH